MQANERRYDGRRKKMQGYGPDRRKKVEGLYLGMDGRKNQRRKRDRRHDTRRSEEQPYESPFPW